MKLFKRPFVYEKLRDDIIKQIKNDEIRPNECVFSENQLAKMYSISPKSVRKAVAELVNNGYLYTIKGKGTFVADQKKSTRSNASRSKILGLIVADLAISFHSDMVRAIEDTAYKNGFQIILGNADNDACKEAAYMRRFYKQGIKGLIVITGKNSPENKYFQYLSKKIPLVIVDGLIKGIKADYVTTDDITGAYEATKHLIELGHRRIAHLAGKPNISTSWNRLTGYKKALDEAGIKFNEDIVKQTDFIDERGYQTMKELLAMQNSPTGVFTVSDGVAIGAARAIQEANLRIPEDISLVGFGGLKGLNTEISLTTVSQTPYKIGEVAAKIFFEKIRGERDLFDVKEVILPVNLTIRGSTGIPG